VQVLPMEEMTLYEQIKALRETTVLVGIHGSGLNNAILLPTDAVLVQLLPYKLNYKGAFQQVARENGVHYIEWGLEDPKLSFFHWEFLGKREMAGGKQAVLDRG
jgi:capsular polysaccharide biosynthesis protein